MAAWRSAVLLAAAAFAAAAPEPAALPEFRAAYDVRYGILRGTMTVRLGRAGNAWFYETELSPAGIASLLRRGRIRERTTFTVDSGTVMPIDYFAEDTLARPARITRYRFDREAGRVTGEYKTGPVNLPMRDDGQNRISTQVAVMLDLARGTQIPDYRVFDRGRWKQYDFAAIPDQSVRIGKETYRAVEIRYSSTTKDRSWSMYCATELAFLPVLITYREAGRQKSRAELSDFSLGAAGDAPAD